jgi:hypothetical protein
MCQPDDVVVSRCGAADLVAESGETPIAGGETVKRDAWCVMRFTRHDPRAKSFAIE